MQILKCSLAEENHQMKTRSGSGRKRNDRRFFGFGAQTTNSRKRLKSAPIADMSGNFDFFNALPDDLVLSILVEVSSNATCPADFLAFLSTCKRINGLGLESFVLSKASPETFAVKARKWSESVNRFLQRCSDAGNLEASYTLGMIQFYCMRNWATGTSLLANAASKSHAPALYSLAVIQFNGSGRSKEHKNLSSGVNLCSHAASLGYIDAIRELGHCRQDGYGVPRNIREGRRLLVQANVREVAAVLSKWLALPSGEWLKWKPLNDPRLRKTMATGSPFLSDFRWNVPPLKPHPANRFLADWFSNRTAAVLCANVGCGRPETRPREFRGCSSCGVTSYCSRACQAIHWKTQHRLECRRIRNQGAAMVADG